MPRPVRTKVVVASNAAVLETKLNSALSDIEDIDLIDIKYQKLDQTQSGHIAIIIFKR